MNEIETILCKVLRCDRSALYLERRRRPLSPGQTGRLEKALRERLQGVPVQYLTGETEFMGLRLRVDSRVLIPRPETEILVEEAIRVIRDSRQPAPRILDIGTGAGNIPIALAVHLGLPQADISSVDISEDCLALARANARAHRVANRIAFLKSDLFERFRPGEDRFHFIISNPPYIPAEEFDALPENVRREPPAAFLAGDKGLYFYRKIEAGARVFLAAGGCLFLETGAGQAQDLRRIFSDRACWAPVRFVIDYNDIERIAVIAKG
jgi:release factor glutamine methyltransferase